MAHNYVVRVPFGDYKVGDMVTDREQVNAIAKSDNVQNVIRVAGHHGGEEFEQKRSLEDVELPPKSGKGVNPKNEQPEKEAEEVPEKDRLVPRVSEPSTAGVDGMSGREDAPSAFTLEEEGVRQVSPENPAVPAPNSPRRGAHNKK